MYCFGLGYVWEVGIQLDVDYFFEDGVDYVFDEVLYVVFVYEGEFYVQLGEFQLVVGMQCFVVEVVCDLVVMVEVGYYQDLFEQLWVLWQGVEFVWVYVCWYQEVVCVFWGGFGQDWGFDVLEVFFVQVVVQGLYQFDVCVLYVLYFWMVQVQVVVFQVGFFVWVFVGVEWQWCSFVQYGDGGGDYFYFVGVYFVVYCVVGVYDVFYLQYVFVVQ